MNMNFTRFHGEYPVKVFLKMWGVLEEDISEPLRTISEKNRTPAAKKQVSETEPDEKLHQKKSPVNGPRPEDVT